MSILIVEYAQLRPPVSISIAILVSLIATHEIAFKEFAYEKANYVEKL